MHVEESPAITTAFVKKAWVVSVSAMGAGVEMIAKPNPV